MGQDFSTKQLMPTDEACEVMETASLRQRVIIDCSHGNSNKDHTKQPGVFESVINQRVSGNENIVGVMLESNINSGNQPLGDDPTALRYGVSITDACVEWSKTEEIILWADSQLA